MLLSYIILHASIVHFTQAVKVRNFKMIQDDDETYQETLDFDNYSAIIQTKHKRNVDETTKSAETNEISKMFNLQPTDGFFAGAETKIWVANKDPETNKFLYILQQNVMEEVNITLYKDKNRSPFFNFQGNFHSIHKKNTDSQNKNISQIETTINQNGFTQSTLGIPKIVYPEILVFVDTTLFARFNYHIVETVAYILTFWNVVDLRFREILYPKVRLNIAGIILYKDEPVAINSFNFSEEILYDFSKFLYSESQFRVRKDYDIAVLLCSNPSMFHGGFAFISGVCTEDEKEKVVHSSAVMLDNGKFSGINVAAHELAHLFGVPHDGEFDTLKIFFERRNSECSPSDGYLMGSQNYDTNQFHFSSCSKTYMEYSFNLKDSECLRNDPSINRTDDQMLRILPGKYISADEQCQRAGHIKARTIDASICLKGIRCLTQKNISDPHNDNVYAVEGTPCNFGSYCLSGECVKITKDIIPRNMHLEIVLPPPYMPGLRKSSNQQCEEKGHTFTTSGIFGCILYCINDTPLTSTINKARVQDGTTCGTNEFCHSGKCESVDINNIFKAETPLSVTFDDTEMSAHEKCQKRDGLFLIAVQDCYIYCTNNKGITSAITILLANDGFQCKPNGECRSGVCTSSS